MLLVKLSDKLGVQYMLELNPGSIFWTISFPVNQILYPPPTLAGADQMTNNKGRAPLGELRRRRGRTDWDQQVLMERLDL